MLSYAGAHSEIPLSRAPVSQGRRRKAGITVKSARELGYMREAGQVVARVKQEIAEAIAPGVTTAELDQVAEQGIRRNGATPSFKGYTAGGHIPFPASICTSLNEEIVHGIPSGRVLEEGDVLSIDVGAIIDGFHGDSAFTVGVGEIDEEAEQLIEATRESLRLGIDQAKAGARVGDISAAVQGYAEPRGYGVVRQYVGHGIGRAMHEPPEVPNYGESGRGPLLRVGMALAIEPMLNIGTWQAVQEEDGWTVVTADGSLSAHFEDTIAITQDGPEVLTALA